MKVQLTQLKQVGRVRDGILSPHISKFAIKNSTAFVELLHMCHI